MERSPTILVVGALSFVGSHLVFNLVQQGFHVRGTARESSQMHELQSDLQATLEGFPGSFEVVTADILSDAKWSDILNGIEIVYHVAFPFQCEAENAGTEMIQPAIEGTRRLMQIAKATPSVKKFILTSCYGTLAENFAADRVYNENDWNETIAGHENGYVYGKLRSEKIAYTIAGEPSCQYQLATFVLGVVWGPPVGKGIYSYYTILFLPQ